MIQFIYLSTCTYVNRICIYLVYYILNIGGVLKEPNIIFNLMFIIVLVYMDLIFIL